MQPFYRTQNARRVASIIVLDMDGGPPGDSDRLLIPAVVGWRKQPVAVESTIVVVHILPEVP